MQASGRTYDFVATPSGQTYDRLAAKANHEGEPMLTGPDVSEHQGNVEWDKVAHSHELAIIRIADGDHRDPWCTEARARSVRGAGLLLAPYYFARVASPQNSERDGEAEAKMAIAFAKSRGWRWPGDLPLIYDFETSNAQPASKCAEHVVQFVRAYHASEGHYPGIYTMPGFWEQILPHLSKSDKRLVARCFLHQAEWLVDAPRPLEPWSGPVLWQWTDSGSCEGVSGAVDMNRSVASEREVLALAKSKKRPGPEDEDGAPKSGSPEPEPDPDRPEGIPRWVSRDYWGHWQKPWSDDATRSSKFRDLCWRNGMASPHFERKETACNDSNNTAVPGKLRANAQRQAFNLEKLRHELGDEPLPVLSWYRTPAHNKAVGGVSQSRHMQADATDFTVQTVDSFGSSHFDAICDQVFADGGFGRYPSGSRHCDSRGSRARW
jgi:GH25 family lysozyme M1 (1,4-beta-N-acetylmuramidase)